MGHAGHGRSRSVTVGHGRVPLLFKSGVSCGHGWSRLVTVVRGHEAKHESQSFQAGTQSTTIGSAMAVGHHGFRNSANAAGTCPSEKSYPTCA